MWIETSRRPYGDAPVRVFEATQKETGEVLGYIASNLGDIVFDEKAFSL
ncbi:MAG: hypothetical protein H6799_00670 [Candidatus Nomurabacteria bacterium]|nr:MAG: hypothetical protein H6799_00670 [Candidatus Nomurabacteria bacterium]HRV75896.1 hypothetical protein [Candidatus Saccharimonadales bacterium]